MTSKTERIRAQISADTFGIVMDMGRTLRYSRKAAGLSISHISQCMGVPESEWHEYENNKKFIPVHIMVKLVVFGMDFWVRNQERFVPASKEMTKPSPSLRATPPLAGN